MLSLNVVVEDETEEKIQKKIIHRPLSGGG
jgi:hypothetical protein